MIKGQSQTDEQYSRLVGPIVVTDLLRKSRQQEGEKTDELKTEMMDKLCSARTAETDKL